MADDGGNPEKEADKKIIHVYPLVKVKIHKDFKTKTKIK